MRTPNSHRTLLASLLVVVASAAACGADDNVNPSNPEAGAAKDASVEATFDAGTSAVIDGQAGAPAETSAPD